MKECVSSVYAKELIVCFSIKTNLWIDNHWLAAFSWLVQQCHAIQFISACALEMVACICSIALHIQIKKQWASMLPALRGLFRLCVWAFELLLVSRIARLSLPALRAFYVAWFYPLVIANLYKYNPLHNQCLLSCFLDLIRTPREFSLMAVSTLWDYKVSYLLNVSFGFLICNITLLNL